VHAVPNRDLRGRPVIAPEAAVAQLVPVTPVGFDVDRWCAPCASLAFTWHGVPSDAPAFIDLAGYVPDAGEAVAVVTIGGLRVPVCTEHAAAVTRA